MALAMGIALVNLSQEKTATDPSSQQSHLIGIGCMLFGACTSGFAGIYFERMVKSTASSIWVRNIQMSVIGFVFASIACLAQDVSMIQSAGFFKGYSAIVWTVILLQAIGGLVVAMVVKYADNILKGFATSGSIILSSVVSAYLFHNTNSESDLNATFITGAAVVCLAAFFYGYNPFATSSTNKDNDNNNNNNSNGSTSPLLDKKHTRDEEDYSNKDDSSAMKMKRGSFSMGV